MIQQVVGFAFEHLNERSVWPGNGWHVALIEKRKPLWMAGLLNGIGGSVEPGETPRQAVAREFEEEAGTAVTEDRWEKFATLVTNGYEISFFRAFLRDQIHEIRSVTAESVSVHSVHALGQVIPNLRWLIPMALHEMPGRGMPFTIHEIAA